MLTSGDDKTLRLWDAKTGRELSRFEGHLRGVLCVAFCPDGRSFVSAGSDRVMRLWDLASGRELRRFEGHTDRIACVSVKNKVDLHAVLIADDRHRVESDAYRELEPEHLAAVDDAGHPRRLCRIGERGSEGGG